MSCSRHRRGVGAGGSSRSLRDCYSIRAAHGEEQANAMVARLARTDRARSGILRRPVNPRRHGPSPLPRQTQIGGQSRTAGASPRPNASFARPSVAASTARSHSRGQIPRSAKVEIRARRSSRPASARGREAGRVHPSAHLASRAISVCRTCRAYPAAGRFGIKPAVASAPSLSSPQHLSTRQRREARCDPDSSAKSENRDRRR